MNEGETCIVCFRGTLDLQDGMLVCDVCGSIAQGFTQETQEMQTGISDGRVRRIHVASRARESQPVEEIAPLPLKEAIEAYILAVQSLLQKMCTILIEDMSVDPELSRIAKEIWFAHVSSLKIIEPAFIKALETKIANRKEQNEPGSFSMKMFAPSRVVREEVIRELPISSSLSILFLACWYLRQAVNPLDIVRWCVTGCLPYLRFEADNAENLKEYKAVLSSALLSPSGVPSPMKLYNVAIHIANSVQLACPGINVALWVRRYVTELELPEIIVPAALELYSLYRLSHQGYNLNFHSSYHPWAEVMALVIVATNMLYGIDGKRDIPASWPAPPSWQSWAEAQLRKFDGVAVPSIAEVCTASPEPFIIQTKTIRQTVFASYKPPEELVDVQRAFDKLADDLKNSPQPGTSEAMQIDAEQDSTTLSGIAGEYQVVEKRNIATAFPSDYAALLAVCAAYVWLLPPKLHEVTIPLQDDVLIAECEVAHLNDIERQARVLKAKGDVTKFRKLQQAYHDKLQQLRTEYARSS